MPVIPFQACLLNRLSDLKRIRLFCPSFFIKLLQVSVPQSTKQFSQEYQSKIGSCNLNYIPWHLSPEFASLRWSYLLHGFWKLDYALHLNFHTPGNHLASFHFWCFPPCTVESSPSHWVDPKGPDKKGSLLLSSNKETAFLSACQNHGHYKHERKSARIPHLPLFADNLSGRWLMLSWLNQMRSTNTVGRPHGK